MSENWSLGFIGAGVMAETMLSGALGKGLLPKESIFASDPNKQRRDLLSQDYGVRTFEDNLEVLQRSDLVVLGVKPQSLPRLLPTGFRRDLATVVKAPRPMQLAAVEGQIGCGDERH